MLLGLRHDNRCYFAYDLPTKRFSGHGWMKIRLEGKKNRFGIGAVLRVGLSDGRTVTRLVSSSTTSEGNSGSPIVQHVGLGEASVKSIRVTWPGKRRPVTYTRPEGAPRFEARTLAVLREK